MNFRCKRWCFGYKVVRKCMISGKYEYCSALLGPKSVINKEFPPVIYRPNEITDRPKNCGPLCVFYTLSDAMCWSQTMVCSSYARDRALYIFECKFRLSRGHKFIWFSKENKRETSICGKALADKVILTKEVRRVTMSGGVRFVGHN